MRAKAAERWGVRAAISCSCLAVALSQSAAAESVPFRTGNSEVQFFGGHPRRIVVHTVSPAQEDIPILGRAYTDEQCHVNAQTYYDIVKPALHGLICFRDEITLGRKVIIPYNKDSTINTHPYDQHACSDVPVVRRVVHYLTIAHYIGQDAFAYALVDPNHNPQSIADVSITVTPPEASRRQSRGGSSVEAPTENEQEPGPMPRCPEPVT